MFGAIGIIKTDKKRDALKIWIYRDKVTGLPKGDASLTYEDPPAAAAAVNWFNGLLHSTLSSSLQHLLTLLLF
jgi:hypothetical protein